jgi:hypothetical protein
MLLIFAVPGGTSEYFARDRDMRDRKRLKTTSVENALVSTTRVMFYQTTRCHI